MGVSLEGPIEVTVGVPTGVTLNNPLGVSLGVTKGVSLNPLGVSLKSPPGVSLEGPIEGFHCIGKLKLPLNLKLPSGEKAFPFTSLASPAEI